VFQSKHSSNLGRREYYTNGSFIPNESDKFSDIVGYKSYNKDKNIKLTYRPLGLRAELTTIHNIIKMTIKDIEPTYIFSNSFNSIYFISLQLRHPTSQNNHRDKPLL
jgi:hypothetical protein